MNRNLPRNSDGSLASYAWPGGYPLFYLDAGNCVLCPECANAEEEEDPIACDANWEDPDLRCEECGKRIESAYGKAMDEQFIRAENSRRGIR